MMQDAFYGHNDRANPISVAKKASAFIASNLSCLRSLHARALCRMIQGLGLLSQIMKS